MARQESSHLTDAELRLMDILWDKGPSTVAAVIESLPARPALAYSTVITTTRILESKGYVRHKKEGRAFLYEPLIGRSGARRGAVANLVRRFFEGSPDLLMAHLCEGRRISARELDRLRTLVVEGR
jgi:predicted transcriptional regulator